MALDKLKNGARCCFCKCDCMHRRNFVAKCGVTAWCETNISLFIRSMQKLSFINADSQSCVLVVFWKRR